jgi:hypothetical protein
VRHRHHVTGREALEHFEELALVGARADRRLPVKPGATVGAKLVELRVERLPVGADAGIAETAVLRFTFGYILRE